MPYHSLTLRLLISAPSDVPEADIQAIANTVSAWNFRAGRDMQPHPVTVLLVAWNLHAHSVFGQRPQAALNEQLVDTADFGLAIFANRLGTDTGEEVSGTVEEIKVLAKAGKEVGIVRNVAVPQPTGSRSARERLDLEDYLEGLIKNKEAFLFPYSQLHELTNEVENLVTRLAKGYLAKEQTVVDEASVSDQVTAVLERGGETPPALSDEDRGIWPSVQSGKLVLYNGTGGLVRNISVRYETEDGRPAVSFDGMDHGTIGVMTPGQSLQFRMDRRLGSIAEAICIVTWQDGAGRSLETRASVRAN